jgi:hypothetical protein
MFLVHVQGIELCLAIWFNEHHFKLRELLHMHAGKGQLFLPWQNGTLFLWLL